MAKSSCCINEVRTKELLAAAGLFDDFDETGLELFDGGNVVCEDAHVASLSWDVHLDAVLMSLLAN
jgi:hypothetical protein